MRRLVLLAAVAAALVPAGHAAAAVRTYPGCGATLAACITAAPAGTTIRLRTNKLIAIPNDFYVRKSLKFTAAKGFHPEIGRTGAATTLFFDLKRSADVSITGIRFQQVRLAFSLFAGSGHQVVLVNNRFRLDSIASDRAILISYDNASRGSVVIRRNDISSSGAAITASVRGGPAVISGNRITSPVTDESEGGIFLFALGSRTVKATVANNVIHGIAGCGCGDRTGLLLRAFDSATLDARILNNTIADFATPGGNGISVLPAPAGSTSHLRARLFNNVVVDTHGFGITVAPGPSVVASGAGNDTYLSPIGDSFGGHAAIEAPVHVAPGFQGPGNYRLGAASPLVNAGRTCIPSLPLTRDDAAGKFRLAGPAVDIGAYERGSAIKGTVKGVNRSGSDGANTLRGTAGRDILCGNGGKDRLLGFAGSDVLFGGLGADRAFGGAGGDVLNVADGVDGNDRADGGPGDDVCITDLADHRTSC